MHLRLPILFKNGYIKEDFDGIPIYFYSVTERNYGFSITNLQLISDIQNSVYVLPKIASEPNIKSMRKTLYGECKIASKCFATVKKASIIITTENTKIDPNAFDTNAEIHLILPSNKTIYYITRAYEDGLDLLKESWLLITDKGLKNFYTGQFESFDVKPYSKDMILHDYPKFHIYQDLSFDANTDSLIKTTPKKPLIMSK